MKQKILYISIKQITDTFSYTKESLEQNLSNNSGNIVFTTAINKYLLHPDNTVDFLYFNKDFVYNPNIANLAKNINQKYNYVVIPAANWIRNGPNNLDFIIRLIKCLSLITVPVLIIGLGAQAPLDYSLEFLQDKNFANITKKFITAVYNTGGSFALRGYFTAEVFEKLGFTNYSVTGCPSLFFNGKDLKINVPTLTENNLKPILNGHEFLASKYWNYSHDMLYKKYSNSIFIDQDTFLPFLLKPKTLQNTFLPFSLKTQTLTHNKTALELYSNDRLKFYGDFYPWLNFIKNNHYNFSFGSRVHGNFVSLLANIPSLIYIRDSRTRELAEYFEIPHLNNTQLNHGGSNFDLYKLYETLDYSNFNKNFSKKFDMMKSFFEKAGINHNLEGNPTFNATLAKIKYKKFKLNFMQKQYLEKYLEKKFI